MKTEKRLTMALSVLVALMMLAVPLASSSNLFVDGGQTNSNGDAPLLGAEATGYTITFKLNADGKSLDQVDLNSIISTLGTTAGETWFIDENGDLCAYVPTGKKIQNLINDLYKVENNVASPLINKGDVSSIPANHDYAYYLNSWKTSDGKTYTYAADATSSSDITSNMVFSAEWTLNEGFVEVPVKVTFDGETKDYVKAYKYVDDDETKIDVTASYFNESAVYDIMGVKVTGLFVNKGSSGAMSPDEVLYTFTAKDSSGKNLKTEDNKAVTITVANNSIILDYTLKSIYSKITVKSIMFEEDVTLYANVGISYSYNDVFKALQEVTDEDNELIFIPATTGETPNEKVDFKDDGSVLVNNKQYKATTWNGSELLYSTNNAVADLTLDATLNSYKVVFMVNGQYEVVDVPFGELSAKKCTLDVTGINRWVTTTDYATFKTFNFTDEEIKTLEGEAINPKYVPQVFIAVFTPTSSTAYAVFDANDSETPGNTTTANFGNELVKKIVVPGKSGEVIPNLSTHPEIEGKYLFMGWKKITSSSSSTTYSAYDAETDKYSTTVTNFCADWTAYESSITFNGDNSVNGVFYYSLKTVSIADDDIISSLVAVEYDGKLYKAPADGVTDDRKAFNDICNKVLTDSKDGYYVNQWKDADGKVVIDKVNKISLAADTHAISGISVKITEIKGDVNFYANFVPEDYLIVYYANTATASNIMVQVGTVDEVLALFGESTFGNEGYVLKEWNTRPDGKGTSYALGSDFTLSGSEYEDALDVPEVSGIPLGYDKCVILYAIWEKVGGSGNEPGNNSDGNNTDTYLLAGILIVIIVLILLIAFLMRRKQ